MDVDLTPELGRLLEFVADVAIAIRMNSAYGGSHLLEDQNRVGADVMWLADSLHNLDTLGRAVRSNSTSKVVASEE